MTYVMSLLPTQCKDTTRMICKHENFEVTAECNRIVCMEGTEHEHLRFACDLRIQCAECKQPFRFLGLPMGLDMNSATVSVDGQEARLSMYPAGEKVPEYDEGPAGFRIMNDG